MKQNELMVA